MSLKSSFENTNLVGPDPKIFFCVAASVADTAAVIRKGTKTLLAHGLKYISY